MQSTSRQGRNIMCPNGAQWDSPGQCTGHNGIKTHKPPSRCKELHSLYYGDNFKIKKGLFYADEGINPKHCSGFKFIL